MCYSIFSIKVLKYSLILVSENIISNLLTTEVLSFMMNRTNSCHVHLVTSETRGYCNLAFHLLQDVRDNFIGPIHKIKKSLFYTP